MTQKNHPPTSSEREGLTGAKIFRFLSLPFQPSRLSTYISVKRVEEVPLKILSRDRIEGVLLDADGTLGPHHTCIFEESVLDHVRAMLQQGLKVAIYTNAAFSYFRVLIPLINRLKTTSSILPGF